MSELIISVSGLRGIVGDSLTAEVATRYAAAFAAELSPGPVVVTGDGRANGPQLVRPVVAGLSRDGNHTVLDGGIAATPTTGVLVKQHEAVGGVQISASHNPAEYNGLKLFSAEGRVLPAAAGEAVRERYGKTQLSPNTIDPAAPQPLADTTSHHAELIEDIVDAERIRGRQFHVLLDANHGAGSVLGKILLERLGCRVTILGGEPDGQFAHPPEPTAENLAGVLKSVTECGAVIGFCQDPDADRLAIIDETGRYLGEEYTLALCVDHMLRTTPGPVVTNCSTSRMTADLANNYRVPFTQSAVGEANVVDQMLAVGAVLGGEGNGGVIDPRVVLVRDSFVGMALVLDATAARDLPVSALADELPRYAICKTKIKLPGDRVAAGLEALAAHFADARADRLDGLRLDWPDRWLLVRPSNTEPIVRAIAEARTEAEAEELCHESEEVMLGMGAT